jgi:acetoin utilization protein AcuB
VRTVGEHMTRAPRAIDGRSSVAEARETMEALGVHHLPVIDGGRLAGVVTERDLDRLRVAKPLVDPEVLAVFQAMSPDPLAVAPGESLAAVVARMVERAVDSAVVLDGGAIRGIFTSTDALRLLAALLQRS